MDSEAVGEGGGLVEKYHGYVVPIVRSALRGARVDKDFFDDLVSAGYLGLVEAAERYDPGSGVPFMGYARTRIRGSVQDAMRNQSVLSAKACRHMRAVQAAAELREAGGGAPVVDGGARPRQNLASVLSHLAAGVLVFHVCSMDEVGDLGDPSSGSPEADIDRKRLVAKIRRGLESLPRLERSVVELHYFQGLSLVEVGRKLDGRSRSWVCRLHQRAIRLLQESVIGDARNGCDG